MFNLISNCWVIRSTNLPYLYFGRKSFQLTAIATMYLNNLTFLGYNMKNEYYILYCQGFPYFPGREPQNDCAANPGRPL